MQPVNRNGTIGPAEPFDQTRMDEHLAAAAVDHVKVFKLKKGMVIDFKGTKYKVTAVRPDGRVAMREKKRG